MNLLLIPLLPLLAAGCALLRPRGGRRVGDGRGRLARGGGRGARGPGRCRRDDRGRARVDRLRRPERARPCVGRRGQRRRRDLLVGVRASETRAGRSGGQRRYYINYNLFASSLLAVPLVLEPALAWIVIELTTLLSVFLVGFDRSRGALEAAWKYAVLDPHGRGDRALGRPLHVLGAVDRRRTGIHMGRPCRRGAALQAGAVQMAFLLVLVGFGAKIGLVPLHTWIPGAYSYAPSPVCALLSGAEATAVLYVILRLVPVAASVRASRRRRTPRARPAVGRRLPSS